MSPDSVIRCWVRMSWTVAPDAGPSRFRTAAATTGGEPVVLINSVWAAGDPVAFATYEALAMRNESCGAVGNSRAMPT